MVPTSKARTILRRLPLYAGLEDEDDMIKNKELVLGVGSPLRRVTSARFCQASNPPLGKHDHIPLYFSPPVPITSTRHGCRCHRSTLNLVMRYATLLLILNPSRRGSRNVFSRPQFPLHRMSSMSRLSVSAIATGYPTCQRFNPRFLTSSSS